MSLAPHSLESESIVLGTLIASGMDGQMIAAEIFDLLRPEDFFLPANAMIYDSVRSIYSGHESWDAQAVIEVVKRNGSLTGMPDGMKYLIDMVDSRGFDAAAVFHSKQVAELSVKRRLIYTADKISAAAQNGKSGIELIETAERMIYELRSHANTGKKISTLAQLMQETYEKLSRDDQGRTLGVQTGYHDLDRITGGLHGGELWIVAARPGMGKTAFGVCLMLNIIAKGTPVLFLSLEMNRRDLCDRLLCIGGKIDYHDMRTGKLNDVGVLAAQDSSRRIESMPGAFVECPSLTALEARSIMRRFMSKHQGKQGVLIVDYLQLMNGDGENRQVEVAGISRTLKSTAMELEMPVIAMSQLNRQPETRANKKPQLSDLRESGAIEQDADLVAMIHREDYYHRDDPSYKPDPPNCVELDISKNRHGETKVIKLHWCGQTMTIANRAWEN